MGGRGTTFGAVVRLFRLLYLGIHDLTPVQSCGAAPLEAAKTLKTLWLDGQMRRLFAALRRATGMAYVQVQPPPPREVRR